MNDELDDLDRAIFSLRLATPPPGLRDAILRATVLAPSATRVTLPLDLDELAILGAVIAAFAVLAYLALTDARYTQTIVVLLAEVARFAADPMNIALLGAGVTIALVTGMTPRTADLFSRPTRNRG